MNQIKENDIKRELIKIAENNHADLIRKELNDLEKVNYKTVVAFIGEFSSGKTTLINALLKKRFLPVFDKPTTAIITKVFKGSENRFLIEKQVNGSITKKEIEVSEIAVEVQSEDKNKILNVYTKDSDIIDNKTILIDTPGVSSINKMHSKITQGYLPNMDVVFMVVNINMGSISKSLENFIKVCPEIIKDKLYFILNFKDTKSIDQREKLLAEFESSIKKYILNPKTLVISSKQAIDAIKKNDKKLLVKSGVEKVETIIKDEIPELHKSFAEKRYHQNLLRIKNDLIDFLEEKESNLNLDKSDFFKKVECLKSEKQKLRTERQEIKNDFENLKEHTKLDVDKLNKEYVTHFIAGLNEKNITTINEQYINDFQIILEKHIFSVENYDLPDFITDKLKTSTESSINYKVGNYFKIANSLPSLINSAALAWSTGGTSLTANLAETAIAKYIGEFKESIDNKEKENSDKKEKEISDNNGKENSDNNYKDNNDKDKDNHKKTKKVNKKVISTVSFAFNILDQLNLTEVIKNKINQKNQKNNVYKSLKNNSDHILKEIFTGIDNVISKKINNEISQPIKIKEEAIKNINDELLNSQKKIDETRFKISNDLNTLNNLG